jgi:hypothetical protein
MIIGLFEIVKRWNPNDSIAKAVANKLKVYVIHINQFPIG